MQASGPRQRLGLHGGRWRRHLRIAWAKATSWTAWGAMAKASAHRCKRDMAWSEDAGRERTKAWMQAISRREREGMDAGIGAKATSWTAWGAMAKASAHRLGQGNVWTAWGAMAKASAHRCKRDIAWSACPDRNSQFDSRHAPAANQIDHVTLRPGAAALAMATNTLRVFLRSPKQARLAAGWAARASRRCHAKAEDRV